MSRRANLTDFWLNKTVRDVIERKIIEQTDYVVWRNGVVIPSQQTGGYGKPDFRSEIRPWGLNGRRNFRPVNRCPVAVTAPGRERMALSRCESLLVVGGVSLQHH
jgi:hypothetical protein